MDIHLTTAIYKHGLSREFEVHLPWCLHSLYRKEAQCSGGYYQNQEKWIFPERHKKAVFIINKRLFGIQGTEPSVDARLHIKKTIHSDYPIVRAGCLLIGPNAEIGDAVVYETTNPVVRWGPSTRTVSLLRGTTILVKAPREGLNALDPEEISFELLHSTS